MKLHQLIRTGGLALALAAASLVGGCDDDDPGPAQDAAADASKPDATTGDTASDTVIPTPDGGSDTAVDGAPAADTGSEADGGASDASAD